MNATSIRIVGVVYLTAAAFVLLPAPIQARAASDVTDRHEIPTFVLDRIELVADTGRVG